MKKITLLIISCMLTILFVRCNKDSSLPASRTSEDNDLAGETVSAGDLSSPFDKLFVLNEGSYGQNNSTLDFFRFKDGTYIRSAFASMNPTVTAGLGDVGNDLSIKGDSVWIAMNNSGIVEVIDAYSEKQIASLSVPSPRQITFDKKSAYVTSYSGAYYGGPDRKGAVYRISLKTLSVTATVNVGHQPEGLAIYGGKLYVANSGGLNSSGYDKTISVIDLSSFTVTDSIEVADNLQCLESDGKGNLWATSFGDYSSAHSNLYRVNIASGKVTPLDVRVSTPMYFDQNYGNFYVIGSEDEWNWDPKATKEYTLYSVSSLDGFVSKINFKGTDMHDVKYPYSILVNAADGNLFIGDAGDAKSPGYVWCFNNAGRARWRATAGLFPGHMALCTL